MKALVVDRPGDPREVLQFRDVAVPNPPAGHVLVRMIASPINPSDLLYVSGNYTRSPDGFPTIPGFEGVGIVERSGGGIIGWMRRGKRVAIISDRAGAWAEYVVIPAHRVVPLHTDISDEHAACFFVNPATALAITEHVLRIPKRAWLLQSAAGSSLGRMIVRLGKRNRFRTINVVRRAEQAAELKGIGADEVVVGEGPAITEAVRKLTSSEGVPFAIDVVGGETGSAVMAALGLGGRGLLFGLLSGRPITIDPRALISTGVRIEGFWLGGWAKAQGPLRMFGLCRRIGRLMREGVLATDKLSIFPVADFRSAVERAMTPGRTAKIVLRLSDLPQD